MADSPTPTHYLGIAGVGKDAATLAKDDPRAGIFGYDRQITFDDVKDGTSYTLMAVEMAWGTGAWTAGGPGTVRGLDPEAGAGRGSPTPPARPTGGLHIDDSPYTSSNGPFGGNHMGGTNVLLVDGSVHFLKMPFDPVTFEAMATYAGAEVSKEKFKVDMLNGSKTAEAFAEVAVPVLLSRVVSSATLYRFPVSQREIGSAFPRRGAKRLHWEVVQVTLSCAASLWL